MSDVAQSAGRTCAPAALGASAQARGAAIARRPLPSRWAWALVVGWAAAIVLGFAAVEAYDRSPGAAGAPASAWLDAGFGPLDGRARVLMFVHPRCPCSRASLAEFERLVAESSNALDAWIVLYRPRAQTDGWLDSDLWRQAEQIPGVRLREDPDGELARRFGVVTSGHTIAYDAGGRLAFSGGITRARSGADAHGHTTVRAALNGGGPPSACPVFGCPILPDEPARPAKRGPP
jgi:hypothetical protein